jgi:hypothetical protein
MKKIFKVALVTALLSGMGALPALSMAKSPSGFLVKNGKERNFEFNYIVNVKNIPAGSRELSMWIPFPKSDEDQIIRNVRIDSPVPVDVTYDVEWGNRMMYLVIKNPDPNGFTFTAKYDVTRYERRITGFDYDWKAELDIGEGVWDRYLFPYKKAIINDAVKRFATTATKGKTTELQKAKGVYDFIIGHMEYNKKIPGYGQGDVARACISISGEGTGYGNCTDFHSLFGSMMRTQGIPVKFTMGYPLKPGKNQEPKAGGYHCWAKFFIPGYGWIPVDISEAWKDKSRLAYYWGSIDENRLTFSEGRDILLNPHQRGDRLNYFGPDPYIEIDGKPFKSFKRLMGYKNL